MQRSLAVLPGDKAQLTLFINDALDRSKAECQQPDKNILKIVGSGIARSDDGFSPFYAGTCEASGTKFSLQFNQRTYSQPCVGHFVVGTIVGKTAEFYRVNIGYYCHALLPVLSFESATKKNRPILEIGAQVYAKVASANRDIEPELSCTSESGSSIGLGPLSGGYTVATSTLLCKWLLLNAENNFIRYLKKEKLSFDLAVGMNGKIWVCGSSIPDTLFLVRLLGLLTHKSTLEEIIQAGAKLKR